MRAGSPRALAFACLIALTALGCADAPTADEPAAPSLSTADEEVRVLIQELLASARATPRSGEMRGRLGMAYEVNGFADSALDSYGQAAALDSGEFRWPYFAALLLAKRGDVDAAIAAMRSAIAINDGYIPAWLSLGAWLREQGDVVAAKNAYRRAEALGAGSPAIAGLALIALHDGKPAEAAALLEPVNATLDHPHLHRMLGRAYRALGRAEDARIAFARGASATPLQWRDPLQEDKTKYLAGFRGQLVHAQKLLRAGQHEPALAMLTPWQATHGEDAALLSTLAGGYLSAGKREQALEILRVGLRAHPEDHHFHFQMALWQRDRGDLAAAKEHLRRSLALNPAQPQAHEELAALYVREQRYGAALDSFDSAIAHGAPNAADLLRTSGAAAAVRGDWADAIDRLRRATERDPSATRAFVQLARALAESGRIDEAKTALDWADRLGTHRGEIAAARGRVTELEAAASSPNEAAHGPAGG